MDLDAASLQAVETVRRWEAGWPAFSAHPSMDVTPERAQQVLDELGRRLGDNYPFFHPSSAGSGKGREATHGHGARPASLPARRWGPGITRGGD